MTPQIPASIHDTMTPKRLADAFAKAGAPIGKTIRLIVWGADGHIMDIVESSPTHFPKLFNKSVRPYAENRHAGIEGHEMVCGRITLESIAS
jgi:hypothetical protein